MDKKIVKKINKYKDKNLTFNSLHSTNNIRFSNNWSEWQIIKYLYQIKDLRRDRNSPLPPPRGGARKVLRYMPLLSMRRWCLWFNINLLLRITNNIRFRKDNNKLSQITMLFIFISIFKTYLNIYYFRWNSYYKHELITILI